MGRLEVRGSHFLSEGEVRELVGPAVGENILALDIEALKARLRASPWVADATVTRALPDTVRVEIRERVPLALAELDRLYLMDEDGGLIDIYGPRTGAFDLPIVRGLVGVEEESRRDRARRAGALLADLAELGSEVSEVYVEPSGDLRVVLRGPGEVLLFGEPPYRQRLVTFLSLRRDLAEKAPDAEHFDLRFRGRIFAKRPAVPPPSSEPGVPPSLPAAEQQKPSRTERPGPPVPQPRPPPATPPSARPSVRRASSRPARALALRPGQGRGRASLALRPGQARTSTRRPALGKKKERYIVGLDVGTHKICAIVAELTDEGRLDVIGIGQTESRGLRKGVVINLEATVDAIKRVLEEAELMAGVEIGSAYVGIAGTHIKGFNSRGVIAVSNKNRVIDKEDVRRVIDAAKAVSIPLDREILHVLPQEFVVDDQDGIGDPTGMTGTRLEVNVHVITCSTTAAQNTVTCVNRAGLEVVDTVLTQIAAAEACLTPDEKELGVAIVDVGGGTTDLAIFEKGSLWHTAVLQVGGEHFTNDVAVALRTPVGEAEKIKKKHGCALTSMIPEEDSIEVPSVGGRKPRIMARQVLGDVLQARAEEICQLALTEIRRAGFERSLNSGVVLTGGGAILEGLPEIAEQIFDMPVRRGTPAGIGGLVDVVASPVYATAVGLVLCGYRNRAGRALGSSRQAATGTFGKVTGRLMGWLSDFF